MAVFFNIRDFLYPIRIIRFKRFINKCETFSKEELRSYQVRQLKKILRYSYHYVPYYRELFDSIKLNIEDIREVKDLRYVPVLTKDILRDRFDDLLSIEYKKYRPFISQTSGSTGTPIRFYLDLHVNIAKLVFFWRAWNWAGYKLRDRMAILEGAVFNDESVYKYDRNLNALRISSFQLTRETSRHILDALIQFKPRIIRCYPSAIYELLKFLKEDIPQINLPSLKAVVTSAETLHDYQRDYIESVLHKRVFDCYHSWESVCMISECEYQVKHHFMEYGVLELLDENNRALDNNELGEMTATGFYNLAMPLIRYKTHDLAVRCDDRDCACGHKHDIIERIDGRIEDIIITPDGRHVGRMDAAFKYNRGFDYAQIIQNDIHSIMVKLVKNKYFDNDELTVLEKHLRDRVGNVIRIKYEFVDHIERGKNGKVRFAINNYVKKKGSVPPADA